MLQYFRAEHMIKTVVLIRKFNAVVIGNSRLTTHSEFARSIDIDGHILDPVRQQIPPRRLSRPDVKLGPGRNSVHAVESEEWSAVGGRLDT